MEVEAVLPASVSLHLSIISSATKDLMLLIINTVKASEKVGLRRRALEKTYVIFLSNGTEGE